MSTHRAHICATFRISPSSSPISQKRKNKKHLLYIQEEQKQTCKNFSRFYTSQIVALNDVKIDIDLTKSKTIEYEI